MDHQLPVFRVPPVEIYSLEGLSKELTYDVNKKMLHYSQLFSRLLFKHLTTETEVHINNGTVTSESVVVLNRLESEKNILCYRDRIIDFYGPWCSILCGQPVLPGVENQVLEIIPAVILCFEEQIYTLQKISTRLDVKNNNSMCRRLCSSTHSVVNYTDTTVPLELQQLLKHGLNFVPTVARNNFDLLFLVENDLKTAAIRFFRANAQEYPRLNKGLGLLGVILQLAQQSPTNTTEVNFYFELYDRYINGVTKFLNDLNISHLENYNQIKKLVPRNSVLSISDKGLGPCLLPVEWYIKQYKHQAEIGGHRAIEMSEQQCLNVMLNNIQTFRGSLLHEERLLFHKYFKKCNPSYRVGCLKIIPKIHKIKSEVTSDSWKVLPSRPIRGGENCPVNGYSIALCKLLQELHKTVKELYTGGKMRGCFPIIQGSDEYMKTISNIEYPREEWGNITILSGDFSDAYTQSRLIDLQVSIKKLGLLAGWAADKISLSQKIAAVVFENCYFITPNGIMQQTKGFPMGGHRSREGLDTILLASEIEIM